MNKSNNIAIINIKDYLNNEDLGEEILNEILSEFSCPLNLDVENFLKNNSIEFTKKNQSVTYLVVSEEQELLGYFTITIKPITISSQKFSNTINRKISRVSELDTENNSYNLSAYLIAQLGKNYSNGLNNKITGKDLLSLAINTIRELQYQVGGMVVFLEAEPKEELLKFYNDNSFKVFYTKQSKAEDKHSLIQLLKVL